METYHDGASSFTVGERSSNASSSCCAICEDRKCLKWCPEEFSVWWWLIFFDFSRFFHSKFFMFICSNTLFLSLTLFRRCLPRSEERKHFWVKRRKHTAVRGFSVKIIFVARNLWKSQLKEALQVHKLYGLIEIDLFIYLADKHRSDKLSKKKV